jgi:hypothetical protein
MDFIRICGLSCISVVFKWFVVSPCACSVPRPKTLRGDAGVESVVDQDAQC